MHILEIDSLHFSYDRKQLLTGVECSLKTGDIVGILGRNGSGKSTFLQIVMGLLSCRSGQIRFDHQAIRQRHRVLSYLPQYSFLFRQERVETIIRMFYPKNKHSRAVIMSDDRIKDALKMKYGRLSGGEKRYLEALLILHLDRPFVLLDEPFKELEPMERSRLVSLIREKGACSGIIITDQAYHDTLAVADRISILIGGRLHHTAGTRKELTSLGYLPP
jgi:ABC-type lipopolysaccharide export system ATPase subunit